MLLPMEQAVGGHNGYNSLRNEAVMGVVFFQMTTRWISGSPVKIERLFAFAKLMMRAPIKDQWRFT